MQAFLNTISLDYTLLPNSDNCIDEIRMFSIASHVFPFLLNRERERQMTAVSGNKIENNRIICV